MKGKYFRYMTYLHNCSGFVRYTPGSATDINTVHFTKDTQTLKQTTTLCSLLDHYILSREWIVIVGQKQTNYHGTVAYFNQSGVT